MSTTTSNFVFATVGTDHHPFDRLVDWVDAWHRENADCELFVQRGAGNHVPAAPSSQWLEPTELEAMLSRSSAVVCHGGPSTIMEARRAGVVPVVVPRDPARGEHVDDHQMRFAEFMAKKGMIQLARTEQELSDHLHRAVQADAAIATAGAPTETMSNLTATIDALMARPCRPVFGASAPEASSTAVASPVGGAQVSAIQEVAPADLPLVSVVVATRDRPEMLRRAIGSITTSDYPGTIETIVVFDQSEADETIVSASSDRPVRILTNARTPGLAGARNTGVLAAQGRLVAFCDDDDEWLPSKLRHQVGRLHADPSAQMVTCGIAVRYDDEDHVRIPVEHRLTLQGFLDDRMTEVHPSSFVMDRDWLIDLGMIDEDLPGSYAEDYDLLLRAARDGRIVSVAEPLVRVHWHSSTYFRERWQLIDDALGFLINKYPEFQQAPAGLARIRGQQAFAAAAARQRSRALGLIKETLKLRPTEKRSLLALAVVAGVPAESLLRLAHRFGRGI